MQKEFFARCHAEHLPARSDCNLIELCSYAQPEGMTKRDASP
ncbi:hypothetical protein [Selenomonas sp. TAMA-11512]